MAVACCSGCVARKEEKERIMAEQHPFKWRHFQAEIMRHPRNGLFLL
jgi:hypothetical protein